MRARAGRDTVARMIVDTVLVIKRRALVGKKQNDSSRRKHERRKQIWPLDECNVGAVVTAALLPHAAVTASLLPHAVVISQRLLCCQARLPRMGV